MTTAQTARNVLAAACVVGAIYVLWLLREVVLLAILAVFVAAALSAPVGFVEQRLRVPRGAAILIVLSLLLVVLVALGLLVVPPLVDEVSAFVRSVPRYLREAQDSELLQKWDKEYGLFAKLEAEASRLPSLLASALSELEAVTVKVLERIVEFVAILAIAFLLLLDAPRLMNFVYRQLLSGREEQARRLAAEAAGAVTGYVAGVFSVAALAGVVSFLAMTVLGIPFAVPLAVLMAFFALLPLVGSSIGAALIAFVAAFEGLGTVLPWLAFWVIYQQTETHVLGPLIYRRAVDMRPIVVIVSVLAGAALLGVLGALLAIPAAATIQIVVREWWRMRHGTGPLAVAPPADAPGPGPGPGPGAPAPADA